MTTPKLSARERLAEIENKFVYSKDKGMVTSGYCSIDELGWLIARVKRLEHEIKTAAKYLEDAYGTTFNPEFGPEPEQEMLACFKKALEEP